MLQAHGAQDGAIAIEENGAAVRGRLAGPVCKPAVQPLPSGV